MPVRTRFWLIALLVLALAALPYVVAWTMTPEGYHYAGVGYNTLDCGSYLAKMRLGWLGEWRFRLMFTPEPQKGAYLFLYYLALGHEARALHLPLVMVYHLARLINGLLLMAALWWLSKQLTQDDRYHPWGFWFALAGGGIGWALPLIAENTVDLWVPEAYGFYSILANAHFPLAQALMVAVFGLTAVWQSGTDRPGYVLSALVLTLIVLGIVQPFALATVGLTWLLFLLVQTLTLRRIPWQAGTTLGVAGGVGLLYPLYAMWATWQDPILAGWNAQNLTPSPPWWNWAVGYGIILPFAVVGVVTAWKRRRAVDRIVLVWLAATLLGIALPITLQRRLSLGLSLPVGMLAGLGWREADLRLRRWKTAARGVLVVLTATTPLLLVVGGIVGVRSLNLKDLMYVSVGEVQAGQEWLDHPSDDVFLASPARGNLIPWLTGRQVVVGHPMETVDFARRSEEAKSFFDGAWDSAEQRAFLCREGVDAIWVGPVERELHGGDPFRLEGTALVLENGDVSVYKVKEVCSNGD